MAIYNAGLLPVGIIGAKLSTVIIAGTVQSSGSPAVRTILIYKNQSTALLDSTTSDAFGDFSIEVSGGTNDCFRIIAVGITDENSVIYEHVCS